MSKIGEKMRARISEMQLSEAEVARRLGISPRRFSYYANSEREPDFGLLQKICSVLKVTPDYLFGYSDASGEVPSHAPSIAHLSVAVPEVDVRAGAGLGGEAILENLTDGNGHTISSDATKGIWQFPPEYLAEVSLRPKQVRIIEIFGDSMTRPDGGGLHSGDRVMVDLGDRNPTPPGIFAIWDGFGVVVKRLERIMGSEPAAIRLISDNPAHEPYERTAGEVNIIGRIVWFARRL